MMGFGDAAAHTHTHTHTRLMALCPGLPGWAGTRKVKPIWILLKQQTVSGSGISWAVCKSATRSRQITMPAPHHSVFLQAGCPSCYPTNSVKALKDKSSSNARKTRTKKVSTELLLLHTKRHAHKRYAPLGVLKTTVGDIGPYPALFRACVLK